MEKIKFSLSMIVPMCNEEELIEEFIEESIKDLEKITDNFEIILIDDGSKDNSFYIAQKLTENYKNLRLIKLEKNLGPGSNILEGIKLAKNEIIFWNTVDKFFSLKDLPKLLAVFDKNTVVSGYRKDLRANPFLSKILTCGNYFLIRTLFPLKLHGYQTAQLHSSEFIKSVPIEARSSFVAPELLLKAYASGRKIIEVPINYLPRIRGEDKKRGNKLKIILSAFKDIFKYWIKWVILKKPLYNSFYFHKRC